MNKETTKMQKLLFDIFDNMQDKIPEQEEANKKICDEINKEVAIYKKQFPEYDWEALRDLCFSVTYTAKKEWFSVGFYYAIGLILKESEDINQIICKKFL